MLYRAYDAVVDSQLKLPGACVLSTRAGPPDLRVRLGPAVADQQTTFPYHLDPDGSFIFSMASVGSYRLHPGASELTVHPHADATSDDLASMLVATALPAWLWTRGDLVLHAGTAVLPGHSTAVAFVGASGIGKSTLLSLIMERGGSIVGDDTLCLRQPIDSGGLFPASGLPAALQLRADAAAPRHWIDVPLDRRRRSAPLGALVFLRSNSDQPQGLRRLGVNEALSALLRNLHRPAVYMLLGQTAALLPRLTTLLASLAVYAWFLPERVAGGALDLSTLDSILDGPAQ